MVETKELFDPLGSNAFVRLMLLTIFGIPLAIHLVCCFLL